MQLEDLKTAWQDEIDESALMGRLSVNAIVNDVAKVNRAVRFRDFWMILALGLGGAINMLFGWLAQPRVDWLTRLGIIAFLAATAVLVVALARARRVDRADDCTLRVRIEIEIERLQKQRKLLNRIGAWFLMPMLLVICLSSLGGYHARTGSYVPDASGWAFYLSSAVAYGITYWLVRREVRNKWDPLLARLRGVLADLSDSHR